VTLRARWVTLRVRWVTLRARWVTLRARWVTQIARWVTLRARWVTVRARWVTLRARWVTLRARWVTQQAQIDFDDNNEEDKERPFQADYEGQQQTKDSMLLDREIKATLHSKLDTKNAGKDAKLAAWRAGKKAKAYAKKVAAEHHEAWMIHAAKTGAFKP
jgi:hypothetical protein